ncbi:SDR family oxidoreductase [Tessaracoccus sp. HDW20]|uniref:SDR family NAD(P)-dependent oxidoreductase n=1 Tax=Tessaracoccus coleopterorum TaxID=2714950 RepID=UPI0018D31670|nr:SDR family oxidoreductase [Tessaracoccus coleopterorum]NHB85481.1 SDR family oxidoreductase [Tessaracoccus coleopterorum]
MSRTWAVVTGASSGLGVAFAERIASEGVNVVLSARSADRLDALGADLRSRYGVETATVAVDLGVREQRDVLIEVMADKPLSYLVNNAGFGTIGEFVDADPDRIFDELNLNVVALTKLSRAAVPGMVARGHGAIINVASTAAFQPLPTMAVYAASKSYVLNFSIALWEELRTTGVRAMAICPGPTDTEFFQKAGDDNVLARRRTPQQVVDTTFRTLGQHRPYAIDGARNSALAFANRFAPAWFQAKAARFLASPGVN